VYSLAQLYGIEGDISAIARQGSGSACRSVDGGFVAWIAGTQADGTDSIAKPIVDVNHWPEMKVLILVVSLIDAILILISIYIILTGIPLTG